jgi:pimeloyl-ACP methyl ester carboxylesterase
MKTRRALLLLLALLPLATLSSAEPDSPSGRWAGLFTGNGDSLEFELNFIKGGALFSVPAQKLFGLPAVRVRTEGSRLEVLLSESEPSMVLAGKIGDQAISGEYLRDGVKASSFSMKPSALPGREGLAYAVDTGRGLLPGTLLMPEANKPPVVLILADSGPTDRDGNNYSVPGKCDSLLMLAQGLKKAGIASLRYDKRGAGESYVLAPDEGSLVFEDYIRDAEKAVRALRADGRFSKVAVIGHGQGSLVGTVAAARGGADAFISLAGVGLPGWQTIQNQLAYLSRQDGESLPASLKPEWERIIGELKAGRAVPQVGPELLSLFRPSMQAFLISWFSFDPKTELGRFPNPVLIVQGGNDSRVGPDDTRALEEGKPGSREVFLPDMNHALKAVLPVESDDQASYSDPSYPLASGLATVIGDFVKGLK